MASPIGEALLLGKLAFKLGRAFTSGRKSAPAEFREVENQLYSLSTALSALQKSSISERLNAAVGTDSVLTSPLGDGQEGSAVFKAMLDNCHATLSHLEKIVQKYAKVKDATDPEAPVFKRWSKKLVTDIKKVSWTTEGGDLAMLRSQLMVHINSINVFLGVVNNMQIGRVEGTLTTAVQLLREIQDYVADTPQHVVATAGESQVVRDPPLMRSFFELYLATSNGEELLCEHALLNFSWDKRNKNSTRAQSDATPDVELFSCGCPSVTDWSLTSHTERLNSFGLTPLSFAIRLVGQELSWMIYKVSDRDTGRNVSVVIKKLSPTYMLNFDELFIQKLSNSWARRWLRQGMGTTLAFVTANTAGEQEARLLNLLGDVSANSPFVQTVSISTMGRTYSRSDIDDIQITHYVAGNLEGFLNAADKKLSLLRPEDFAEIVIYYGGSRTGVAMDLDEDVVKTTLRLKFNSKLEYRNGEASVTFPSIHCTSAGEDGVGSDLPNGKVTITFSTPSAAQGFSKKVQQMRVELSIIFMRLPRPNEVVVMKLQTGGVHTEEVAMTEADIIIVQNVTDRSYRLIITSHDGRTVISQKLASDFTGTRGSGTNFRSLTWVVNVQEDGRVRIGKCPNGFTHLVLSDVRTNRLFEKWVQSQLWQNTLPTRGVPTLTGSDRT